VQTEWVPALHRPCLAVGLSPAPDPQLEQAMPPDSRHPLLCKPFHGGWSALQLGRRLLCGDGAAVALPIDSHINTLFPFCPSP
jgi:hypothetical protein